MSEDVKKPDQERAEEVDAEILAVIVSHQKLASDIELAKGINYTKSIKTTYNVTAVIPTAVLIYLLPGGNHLDISTRGLRNSTTNSKIISHRCGWRRHPPTNTYFCQHEDS